MDNLRRETIQNLMNIAVVTEMEIVQIFEENRYEGFPQNVINKIKKLRSKVEYIDGLISDLMEEE